MKHTICILLTIAFVLTSCKNKKNTATLAETVTVTAKKPNVTFISETLGLTHCESAVYDTKRNVIYASLIGNKAEADGAVAKLSLEGKVIHATFITNLNDPKGIAITKDKLYVSDVTELVEADLETGKIINKYSLDGIKFLNDAALDNTGNVFVSDTSTSKIYKLDTEGNFTLWFANEALDKPNGLLIQDNMMYVASWGGKPEGGRVSKIEMATKSITPISTVIGNLDGIRVVDKSRMIISDWRSGNIHLIDYKGNTEQILKVGQSVGDIAYIKEKKLLLLPMNKQSRLLFYQVEE